MGRPNHELVPAAILWMNPGITKEEYVKLLNECFYYDDDHGIDVREFLGYKGTPFAEEITHIYGKIIGTLDERSDQFHKGLYGLGEILNLDLFGTRRYDFSRLDSCDSKPKWIFDIYELDVVCNRSTDPWTNNYTVRNSKTNGEENFDSLTDLLNKFPELSPELFYDFSKIGGNFKNYRMFGNNPFKWKMKGNKYYFDEKSFDGVPASLESDMTIREVPIFYGFLGYDDLALTKECIERKYWRGLGHLDGGMCEKNRKRFFRKNPGMENACKKATFDIFTSRFTEENEMTVKEFLEYRALNRKLDL